MSTLSVGVAISTREHSRLEKIRAAWRKYRIRRQHYLAARTLSRLSDHVLKDMGVGRSEIHAFVSGPSADHRHRGP
jgi:uncharacterized protein YjiS (DUF1127 family)